MDRSNFAFMLRTFTARENTVITKRALQEVFKKTAEKAGISNHSIHCPRHTFGSHLYLSSNHNLRLVQEQLGHSSVKFKEVYAGLMNSDVKNAIEKLYR